MNLPNLTALRERAEKLRQDAHEEISGLCSGKRRWTMCIPVEKTDSDILLQSVIDALKAYEEMLQIAVELACWIKDETEIERNPDFYNNERALPFAACLGKIFIEVNTRLSRIEEIAASVRGEG